MSKVDLYEYEVVGKGNFPIDMLRRDRCWPAGPGDLERMFDSAETYAPTYHPKPDAPGCYEKHDDESCVKARHDFYNLSRTVQVQGCGKPTMDRWLSFGWTVKNVRKVS